MSLRHVALRYLDFDLKIERAGKQFTARVLSSPAGETGGAFQLQLTDVQVEDLIKQMSPRRNKLRGLGSPEMAAAREFGEELFKAAFGPEVLRCLRDSMQVRNRNAKTGLRIRLRLQDVPQFADLPWEYLLDSEDGCFLAHSDRTLIVRYVEMPSAVKPLRVSFPLRLLAVASSPTGFATLDLDREKSVLERALKPLTDTGRLHLTWLEDATLSRLERTLQTEQFHVFHFIGHGGFDERSQLGALYFHGDTRDGAGTDAHRLGTLLKNHPSLRLAVLNACEGARNSRTDPFASVATTLARVGIPAVIAMQFEITDKYAIIFAERYYGALADGLPVDAAMAQARVAMYLEGTDVEWGTPVLYMRCQDGRLFDIKQSPKRQKPGQPSLHRQSAAVARQFSVFVSSSIDEFRDLRSILKQELDERLFRVILFDHPRANSRDAARRGWLPLLKQADVYIGIFGRKYGTGTVDEFERAREMGKPCFLYVRHTMGAQDPKLHEFIEDRLTDAVVPNPRIFSDGARLAAMVAQDIQGLWNQALHQEPALGLLL